MNCAKKKKGGGEGSTKTSGTGYFKIFSHSLKVRGH